MSLYCCFTSGQILQHLDSVNIVTTIFPFIFSWYEVRIIISVRNWMFFFYPTCTKNRVLAELHCSSCKLCLKARAALLIGLGWRPCLKKRERIRNNSRHALSDILLQILSYNHLVQLMVFWLEQTLRDFRKSMKIIIYFY